MIFTRAEAYNCAHMRLDTMQNNISDLSLVLNALSILTPEQYEALYSFIKKETD